MQIRSKTTQACLGINPIFLETVYHSDRASRVTVKNLPAMQETLIRFLGLEVSLEEGIGFLGFLGFLGFPGGSAGKEFTCNKNALSEAVPEYGKSGLM